MEDHFYVAMGLRLNGFGGSVPSTGARQAQETRSDDVPAPMETGGVGDGWSWVDHVEASADDEFQRDRPTKRCQSQLRRQED